MSKRFQPVVGLYIADSYMRMADRAAKELLSREPGAESVAISSMAFAMEVYFKTIIYMMDDRVERGHDLAVLWGELPEPARECIQRKFDANYKPSDSGWTFTALIDSRIHGEGSSSTKVEIPGKSVTDIIEGHKDAFRVDRYGYELPADAHPKVVIHAVPGLQLLSWIARELAHSLVVGLADAKKAIPPGEKRELRLTFNPTGPVVRFPHEQA